MKRFLAWLPIIGAGLLAAEIRASDVYVSPRTGEVAFTQKDHELATPLGRVPVTRSYDANEMAGVLGQGWRLDLLSEIRFLDESRFVAVQAGKPVFFQKVKNGQRFEGPMGARASLEGKEWVIQSGDGDTSRYDEKGREISRSDTNGNKITFAYDSNGRIAEIVAVAGYALKFRYGANGRLAAIADSSERSCEYQYDASRRLSQVRDADGWTTGYSYDTGSRLSGIQFPSGEKVQFTYDNSNRVSQYSSSREPSLKYTHAPVSRVTRQDGYWWEMVFDNQGRPTESRDSLKRVSRMTWNDKGQLASQQFPDGSTTAYFYDDLGRSIKEASGRGDTLETTYNGASNRPLTVSFNGALMRLSYDGKGNLISRTTPAGRRTSYAYDSGGRAISVTDGEGRTVRIEHDQLGNQVRQVNPDKGVITWEYDGKGSVLRRKDASGSVTQYQYDSHGHLIGTELPGGVRFSRDYDSAGRVVRESQGTQALQYTYNAPGNVARVDHSDGTFAALGYDQLGNLAAFTDALGLTSRKQFDALGRQVAMTYPSGATATTAYDADGKVRSLSIGQNTAGISTEDGGRRILFRDPAGGETRILLDKLGEVIEQVTPAGGIERRTYDPDGLIESVTLPQGDSWRFAYDNSGSLKEVAFPDGSLQKWEYDPAGRLGALVLPWGARTLYRYDSSGLLVEMTNARGERISYQYDQAGRLARKQTAQETWEYKYDVQGNLLQAGNGTFTVRYSYDSQSRLLEIDYPEWRKAIRYSYDKFGRVTSRSEPDGRQTLYTYDSLGRLSRIANERNEAVTLTYNQAGRLIARSLPNGTRTEYTYDRFDRIIGIEHKNASGQVISAQRYVYDLSGNRVEAQDEQGQKSRYRYDNEGRLIDEQGPSWEKAYVYGSGGNRSSMSDNTGNTSYRYDQAGRLIQAGELSFAYDADGNLVSRRDKSGATRFTYDSEDRLVKAELPDGKTIAYGYGPFGERIYREENGRRTNYLLDGNGILQELSRDYQTQASYFTAGLDQPLFMTFANGKRCFFHQDVLGSILAVSDEAGRVGGRYFYDAFGNILNQQENGLHQPLRYTGRPLDEVTGLYDFRARFYDSRVGRFVSPDPIPGDVANPASFAPYLYVHDNPVGYTDPSGLDFLGSPVSPDADDLFKTFRSLFKNQKPPFFLYPEWVAGPVRTSQLDSPETEARLNEHMNWLRENFGEKTAQGFFDRYREYTRQRRMANPAAVGPSGRTPTRNGGLPAANPERSVVSPAPPQPAPTGAAAAAPAEVAAGTYGRAASFKPLGVPTEEEIQANSLAATAGALTLGVSAADAFGENYDLGTKQWKEDAFDNLDRKAYNYLSSPNTLKKAGVAGGVGAVGYVFAGTATGAAIAGLGAVAAIGTLGYVAGNRIGVATREGLAYDQALFTEAGDASRAGIQTTNIANNFADILASLKRKAAELDDLRPKAQAAFDEIAALDREIGNAKNTLQNKKEKLDPLWNAALQLYVSADLASTSAAPDPVMVQVTALLDQIRAASKTACDLADGMQNATASQDRQAAMGQAQSAAGDAEAKSRQVSSLFAASPAGGASSMRAMVSSLEAKIGEINDLVADMSGDKTSVDERIQICESDQPLIERAAALQADIHSNLELLSKFNDPSGELAGIRQRAAAAIPSKNDSLATLTLARQNVSEAAKICDYAQSGRASAQRYLETARVELPPATAQADPQALIAEAASLAQQARACADRCKQAASSGQGTAGNGFGDGQTTGGIDPLNGKKNDQTGTDTGNADKNAAGDQKQTGGFGDGQTTGGIDPLNGKKNDQTGTDTGNADKNAAGDQKQTGGFGDGQTTSGTDPLNGKKNDQTGTDAGKAPSQTTSLASGQPAAYHIFATGSRLGWAGGLSQYSEGASDQSIIDHLNAAGEHARMANYESYPPAKAWPGWSQMKTQFTSWGQLVTRYPNDTTRRQIANAIKGAADSLEVNLTVQTAANIVATSACDQAYIRLGFHLAYGQQVMSIADEAARNSSPALSRRAQQDATANLETADQVLLNYEHAIYATGRCAELGDVRTMIERLLQGGDLGTRARSATVAWELALERIRSLSRPGTTAASSSKYDECVKKYCPMCAQTITLLGASASSECNDCKVKNAYQINSCVGSPQPQPIPRTQSGQQPGSRVGKQSEPPVGEPAIDMSRFPYVSFRFESEATIDLVMASGQHDPGRSAYINIQTTPHAGSLVGNTFTAEWNEPISFRVNSPFYTFMDMRDPGSPVQSRGRITVEFDSTYRLIRRIALTEERVTPDRGWVANISLNLENVPGNADRAEYINRYSQVGAGDAGEKVCTYVSNLQIQVRDIQSSIRLVRFGCSSSAGLRINFQTTAK